MPDANQKLYAIITEQLQENPNLDQAQLEVHIQTKIEEDSQLATALSQSMLQINLGNTTAFQTLVEGGIAYIGPQVNIKDHQLKSLLEQLLQRLRPIGIPSNLPRSGVVEFVGRAESMTQLHEILQQGERVAVSAIAGMGGIGKTELALQYALAKKQTYAGGLCWLQARSGDVGRQLVRFGQSNLNLNPPDRMELADQVKYCWRNWQAGEVLLVFDDVTDYGVIEVYLPPSTEPRFKVLMTTRRQLGRSVKQLQLDVLDEAAALELLKSLVEGERIESQLDDAKRLCEQLGYLPLGLELAGRYLARKANLSVAELLKRLEEKQLAAKALCQTDADMTAKLGVAAAFELSWSDLSTDAQHLGCGLSLFAAVPIPWSSVEQCFAEQDPEELEDWRDDELLNLHLLQWVADSTYRLHPLIREFLRIKQKDLTAADEQKYNYCTAMVEVAKKIPQTSTTLQEITKLTPVIPHLTEAATVYNSWLSDEDLIWSFFGLGRYYEGQGAYAQALPWLEQCLSFAKERWGEEHLAVALSYNNLAGLYKFQGRYGEAEPLYQKALPLTQRLLGEEHPDVATSYNNLAGLYQSQGRYGEAEPLYQKALPLTQRLLGEEHPDVATSYNNLAGLYQSQGRYGEAEPLYQKALPLTQRLLGEEHPDVATSYNNLAGLYKFQGRYGEAEPLYQKALALRQRLLGEEHPDVAISYNNLAELYLDQGRYGEAEPLYQKALALAQKLLGEEHPAVATSYNNLAGLYLEQGRYGEAEPLYQKALVLRQKLLGEEHPVVASSYNGLALLYQSQERYGEAEPLFQKALALAQKLPGEEHPADALTYNALAGLYQSQGRYGEAELLYQKALALRQKLLGEEHPAVAISYNDLAELYFEQGRYGEAEPLFQKALEIAELSLGVNHPHTVTIRNNLKFLRDNQAEQ